MMKDDFPILKEKVYNKPLVYLDNAATSQKPTVVLDAIIEAYTHWNANIHRGVHHLSQVSTQHHEKAREHVARFFHAHSAKEIIFTKGTTDSINILAFSYGEAYIHEGDEIIVSQLEHHSNIVPWQMLVERKKATLRVIPLQNDLSLDIEAYKTLINEKTKLVAITHVSNVIGIVNPIEKIIDIAHQKNIPVLIDGAQSAPHIEVNLEKLDCDFYVCSSHKMYGPTGLGILYGKEKWLNSLPPSQGGGEMIEKVRFEHTTYNQLPYKFEAGTPNYIGSYTYSIALNYLEKIGWTKIEEMERTLLEYCEEELNKLDNVVIYAAGQKKVGAISFNVYNQGKLIHPFDVGTLLDKQGIAVRTGHHCAEPLIDYLNIPGTVRVSTGIYTDKQDIDQFILALKKAILMLC